MCITLCVGVCALESSVVLLQYSPQQSDISLPFHRLFNSFFDVYRSPLVSLQIKLIGVCTTYRKQESCRIRTTSLLHIFTSARCVYRKCEEMTHFSKQAYRICSWYHQYVKRCNKLSKILYCIAGNFCMGQIFEVFTDSLAAAK